MRTDAKARLLLAGHLHVSHIGNTATRYMIDDYAALVVQAGTATSTRRRSESNSFNVIRIVTPGIEVERQIWQPATKTFVADALLRFDRRRDGWHRLNG